MKKSNFKGFTLIELLVVIVIIGILATLATVALSSAREKARDARRVSDVRQIQTALELFYNEQSGYPSESHIQPDNPIYSGSNTFMAKIPTNPSPYADGDCASYTDTTKASWYVYTYDASGSSYHIRYCLGNTTGDIAAGTWHATPASIADTQITDS